MKPTIFNFFSSKKIANSRVLLLTSLILFISCERSAEDYSKNDQLPTVTQVGADTAGCLVNGKVLVAKANLAKIISWGPAFKLDYFSSLDNSNLTIAFENQLYNSIPGVSIFVKRQKFEEGKTYQLTADLSDDTKTYAYANYSNNEFYTTTNTVTGELTITHIDTTKYIISGTFWFNAVNSNGETVKITDGRFDGHY